MAASESKFAVVAAIVGNSIVCVAKFGAFMASGSGVILAEAIHTLADVMNQTLLYLGIVRSSKEADVEFQYGYGRERFIWSLISAVGIFFLGCGVTIYHGIHRLMHPSPINAIEWAIGVLIFALIVEGIILYLAAKSLYGLKGEQPFMEYLRTNADPPAVAVLLVDAAACLGVIIAIASILLSRYTGMLWWDGVGSLMVGGLLGAVAVWLIARNREVLIGQAMPSEARQTVRKILSDEAAVRELVELKSDMIDTETYDLLLGVQFNAEFLRNENESVLQDAWEKGFSEYADLRAMSTAYTEGVLHTLGTEIDAIEAKLRAAVPQLKHIDIEPEANPIDTDSSAKAPNTVETTSS